MASPARSMTPTGPDAKLAANDDGRIRTGFGCVRLP
jgi:hypothetical protein